VELVELAGVDHLGPIEPGNPAWTVVLERLGEAFAPAAGDGGVTR
jgi:hypothetical protein